MKHDERINHIRLYPQKLDKDKLKAQYAGMTRGQKRIAKKWGDTVWAIEAGMQFNGSNLKMADSLREFVMEYNSRIRDLGWSYLPSSFNVIEAFMDIVSFPGVVRLQREEEYIVPTAPFWEFVTKPQRLANPDSALRSIREACVYSYDFEEIEDITFSSADDKNFLLSGVSLIRHEDEVTFLIEAGKKVGPSTEFPENFYDSGKNYRPELKLPDKVFLNPIRDNEDYQRILIAYRLNFQDQMEGVKYVLEDYGSSYMIYTNDPWVIEDIIAKEGVDTLPETVTNMLNEIEIHNPLFQLCHELITLPLFIEDNVENVRTEQIQSELKDFNKKTKGKLLECLPPRERIFIRNITRVRGDQNQSGPDAITIQTPEFEFETAGYWKTIDPEATGEGKKGEPVRGRTWIKKKLDWRKKVEESFLVLKKSGKNINFSGEHGGYIYVLHSASQHKDIFKIGRTKRRPEQRAAELSQATGVATPFLVVRDWWFDDCVSAEKLIHEALDKYRVNESREHFQCSYQEIHAVIEEVDKFLSSLGEKIDI
jgi:hypothetical protein